MFFKYKVNLQKRALSFFLFSVIVLMPVGMYPMNDQEDQLIPSYSSGVSDEFNKGVKYFYSEELRNAVRIEDKIFFNEIKKDELSQRDKELLEKHKDALTILRSLVNLGVIAVLPLTVTLGFLLP